MRTRTACRSLTRGGYTSHPLRATDVVITDLAPGSLGDDSLTAVPVFSYGWTVGLGLRIPLLHYDKHKQVTPPSILLGTRFRASTTIRCTTTSGVTSVSIGTARSASSTSSRRAVPNGINPLKKGTVPFLGGAGCAACFACFVDEEAAFGVD